MWQVAWTCLPAWQPSTSLIDPTRSIFGTDEQTTQITVCSTAAGYLHHLWVSPLPAPVHCKTWALGPPQLHHHLHNKLPRHHSLQQSQRHQIRPPACTHTSSNTQTMPYSTASRSLSPVQASAGSLQLQAASKVSRGMVCHEAWWV